MQSLVVGVDGCRAGWIACQINADSRDVTFAIYATISELLAGEATPQVIAIDIPIGLRDDWTPRACDREARKLLGPRSSSIFPAPPRPLLTSKNFKEANERSRRLFHRGLSQQSFHLFPKIRQIDAIACTNDRIYEVHPELAFRQFAGTHLHHSKKTIQGYNERSTILRMYNLELPDPNHWRIALNAQGVRMQRDDVADAAVAALVALRILHSKAVSIPTDSEHDSLGIPMRMLY